MNTELTLVRYQTEIEIVKDVVDLVVSSQSIQDLCRKFVHEDFAHGMIQGSYIYSINTSLDIVLEIGYGKTTNKVRPVASAWEEDCPLASCVKNKTPVFRQDGENCHLAIPLLRENIPIACLMLVLDSNCSSNPISEVTFEVVSKIGAFFVETKPTRDAQKAARRPENSMGALTQRQRRILQLASEGLTNAAIGKEVSLSESTVRQETIRIYRALEATGRLEAIAKARQSGLIPNI